MKIRVTAKNYPQEVLRSETPVLVEFFAVWCGKCAMMEDVLDEIAKEYDGRVKVCQIEIEESAVLAAEFEVGIVPAFAFYFCLNDHYHISKTCNDPVSCREKWRRRICTRWIF